MQVEGFELVNPAADFTLFVELHPDDSAYVEGVGPKQHPYQAWHGDPPNGDAEERAARVQSTLDEAIACGKREAEGHPHFGMTGSTRSWCVVDATGAIVAASEE